MVEKLKICLAGAAGVGKTSLVSRFSRGTFTTDYRTTIGVSIERRDLERGGRIAQLVIWDLSGEDEFQTVQPAYFRGAAGYLIVIDGSRSETLETAIRLQSTLRSTIDSIPFVVALNKADLVEGWSLKAQDMDRLRQLGWKLVHTSAKTGAEVDEVFGRVVDAIWQAREGLWF